MKVAADIGGSNSRISVDGDRSVFSSSFVLAPERTNILKDISDPLEDVLIRKEGKEHISRILRGDQMGKYSLVPETCGNEILKACYPGTKYNLLIGICKNMDKGSEAHPSITLCLPPEETFSDTAEAFKEGLVGTYIVSSSIDPTETYKIVFEADNIKIAAEGLIGLTILTDLRPLAMGYCVVLDVGYRSTDITFLYAGRPVGGAYRSDPTGGMNMLARLESEMSRLGKFLALDEVQTLLATGCYRGDTTTYVPTVEFVKKTFAQTLYRLIVETGNLASINVQSVSSIVPIGRPFTKREGMRSLAEYVASYFPNDITTVDFPEDVEPELVNLCGCEKALGIDANANKPA